ncbi:MAG: hypothetical protein ACK526_01685 [Planctomyces sp.]
MFSPSGRWYIDPYFHLDTSVYASYFASSDPTSDGNRQSRSAGDTVTNSSLSVSSRLTTSTMTTSPAGTFSASDIQAAVNRTSGSQLRTYRAAIAATGSTRRFTAELLRRDRLQLSPPSIV